MPRVCAGPDAGARSYPASDLTDGQWQVIAVDHRLRHAAGGIAPTTGFRP